MTYDVILFYDEDDTEIADMVVTQDTQKAVDLFSRFSRTGKRVTIMRIDVHSIDDLPERLQPPPGQEPLL